MSERLHLVLADQPGRGPQPYDVEFDGRQLTGPELRVRWGRNRLNEPVVQKLAHGGPPAHALLRREREIGMALRGRLAAGGYPSQLGLFLGHNADSLPPYLVATSRGESLAELAVTLPLPATLLAPVVQELVRALRWLSAARVVHGRIDLATLRWDGSGLQLVDFEHAVLEGEPYPACSCCSGRVVEQRPAAHRDDVRDAGLVIYRLYTGEGVGDAKEARDRLDLQDAPLRALLADVFDDRPDARPDARVLLRRLRLADPTRRGVPPVVEDRELRARARFRDIREGQRAFRATHYRAPAAGGLVTTSGLIGGRALAATLAFSGLLVALIVVLVVVR
jgi:hypothetical protein